MPIELTIFLALGGSTLISLIVTSIWRGIENKARKSSELLQEARVLKIREEEEKRHREWVEEARLMLAPMANDIKEIKADFELDKKSTITNLRVTMKALRDQLKAQGYADELDKITWNELYDHYTKMGGNYLAKRVNCWKAEVDGLPEEK